jgi:hypothetical protein
VRRHGGQAQSGAPSGCRGWPLRPRGVLPRRGAPSAYLRGRSPCQPIAPPAFLAG